MLDLFHIDPAQDRTRTFWPADNDQQTAWQTWIKPRGISFIHVFGIGGGGLGGSGFTGATSTLRGGGGGGGSGGTSSIIFPAANLPDVLYVQPGGGGDPQYTSAGRPSYISVAPSNAIQNLCFGALGGQGGGTGTSAAGGTAGANPAAFSNTLGMLLILGVQTNYPGGSGSAGGAGLVGVALAFSSSLVNVIGGSGGGGASSGNVDSAGGAITGLGFVPSIAGGAALTIGSPGFTMYKPFFSTGGTGGGSNAAGTGGQGGMGGIGCGGGGGGGGITGGKGGLGGPGFITISCW